MSSIFPFDGEGELVLKDYVVPIEQTTPEQLRASLMGMQINAFGDLMSYFHMYPEIIGYDRRGNGRTDGDASWFTLSSITNSAGIGSLHIQFPPMRNSVDNDSNGGNRGAIDGIFHSNNRGFLRGYSTYIVPVEAEVSFGPERGSRYQQLIPFRDATLLGLYATYNSTPNARHDFLVFRRVLWGDLNYLDFIPRDSAPPSSPPEKGELISSHM